MNERPNKERCNLCGEWHKEGIENYAEHLKTCSHTGKSLFDDGTIDYYSCRGDPHNNDYCVTGSLGVKQTFTIYIKPYARTGYFRGKTVQLTRVGTLVSLDSFYDMGRIPWTLGWGNGRVSWIGQKGSKWLRFLTWDSFRWRVLDRDGGKCRMCGRSVAEKVTEGQYAGLWKNDAVFVCDHIIPLCKDGKDWHEDPEMLNFQTLCVDCNKIKTKNDMDTYRVDRRLEKQVGKNGFTLLAFASCDNKVVSEAKK